MTDSCDENSDESFIYRKYLTKHFGLCMLPSGSTLYYCAGAKNVAWNDRTFHRCAFSQAHAATLFAREQPTLIDSSRVFAVRTIRNVFLLDMDPLQYTRAYTDELLACYAGAVGKVQTNRRLADLRAWIEKAAANGSVTLDMLALLSSDTGFCWGICDVVGEIQELHPLVCGALHLSDSIFGARALTLCKHRVLIEPIGAPLSVASILQQNPMDRPMQSVLPIVRCDTTDELVKEWLEESTGYTMLDETGVRKLYDLRRTLLQFAASTQEQ